MSNIIDEAFKKMKENHQNNVNYLLQWMKDAKIVDQSKATEENAKNMLSKATDKNNIDLEHFKSVVSKIAGEKKVEAADLFSKLNAKILDSKVLESIKSSVASAFDAGYNAIKGAMKK